MKGSSKLYLPFETTRVIFFEFNHNEINVNLTYAI